MIRMSLAQFKRLKTGKVEAEVKPVSDWNIRSDVRFERGGILLRMTRGIRSLNWFFKRSWRVRDRETKIWEGEIYAALMGRIPKAKGKMKVLIISHRARMLDKDNFIGGTKTLTDALKRLGLIVDDNPEYLEADYRQVKAHSDFAHTSIQIQEVA